MALADDLKAMLPGIRAIPGELGLRPYAVSAAYVAYQPEFTIGSTYTTPIVEGNGQNPKVRWLRSDELAIGGYHDGTVEVGPITPGDGATGTLLATLIQTPNPGDMARFILTGPLHPDGANYVLKRIEPGHALHYTLTLERSA